MELVSTEDKQVYWSWHLWFTDYKPDKSTDAERKGQVHKYTASQTKYMMDRNLGAIATGVTGAIARPTSTGEAIKYYGLNYQFGRKDPFVGSGDGTTNFVAIYDATGKSLSNGANIPFKKDAGSRSTSFLAKVVMNPFTFYYTSSVNWTLETDGLWGENGDKSPFDPCPPGWRVPITNIWSNFSTSNFVWGVTATGTNGRMYTGNNVQAWFPAFGNLSEGSGILASPDCGYFWRAMPNDRDTGYELHFTPTGVYQPFAHCRARGISVRCIQE